jgi:transcriptional regulator with XRE-family HTH domain
VATIKPRTNKDGSTSYLIRAYSGYDGNGKQIEKTMTWKPAPGLSPRQAEKAVKEAAVIFERKVKDGIILDGGVRFADFAERWMNDYSTAQHAPKTKERYEALLVRINQALGNVRLDKLQPHHLQEFYKNLGEDGIKHTGDKAVSMVDLPHVIKDKRTTQAAVSRSAGISSTTVLAACQGKRIALANATAIAKALEYPVDKLFTVERIQAPLSDKTIMHHHRLISSILQTAVQWQVIFDNPARRVKPPKVERKEAEWL